MNIDTDLIEIKPMVFGDKRGHFFESYNKKMYNQLGITCDFIQDNESYSTKGVLRGMHYQSGEHAQAKLVRVTKGEVFDVAIDMRKNSPTFKQWKGIILSESLKNQFFIPKGFAHGFLVLSEYAIFNYKVDNDYNKESESGIIYNDESINIKWPQIDTEIIVSEKDGLLPTFENAYKF